MFTTLTTITAKADWTITDGLSTNVRAGSLVFVAEAFNDRGQVCGGRFTISARPFAHASGWQAERGASISFPGSRFAITNVGRAEVVAVNGDGTYRVAVIEESSSDYKAACLVQATKQHGVRAYAV